jgi:hypothetical protein
MKGFLLREGDGENVFLEKTLTIGNPLKILLRDLSTSVMALVEKDIFTPSSATCEAAWYLTISPSSLITFPPSRGYTLEQCDKKGMYCHHQENITYKTVCKSLGQSDSFDSNCPNITLAFELCPNGFYCPNNSTKKICPIGSSCFLAADHARLCPIQGLLCPYEGMSYPSEGAMIITFALIYFLVLFIYKWISDCIVAQRERSIDSNTLAESQQIQGLTSFSVSPRHLTFLSRHLTLLSPSLDPPSPSLDPPFPVT